MEFLTLLMWIGIFWMGFKGANPNWNYAGSGVIANIFQVICLVIWVIMICATLGLIGQIVQGWFSSDDD